MSSDTDATGRALRGECECGTVRYQVADEFLYAANCHCSRCRAATGSAFKPFAGIEREKLTITDGVDAIADLRRGAPQPHALRGLRLLPLLRGAKRCVRARRAGLASRPSEIRPTEHIFVGSKAPWFEITDDLPQHDEYATPR